MRHTGGRLLSCLLITMVTVSGHCSEHTRQETGVRAVAEKSIGRESTAILNGRKAIANEAPFPRLAAISYAGKYDMQLGEELSKYALVIVGTPQPVEKFVERIKRSNPRALVGIYTLLNEARRSASSPLARERTEKLDREGWWLKDGMGRFVQWTKEFDSYDINVTEWATPDADGYRYPEWAARFWYRWLFQPMPDVDIWFFDNVFVKQRLKSADWRQTGRDQSGDEPEIQAAFRRAQATEIAVARVLAPAVLMVGNADNDLSSAEYAMKLDGAQMECMMGQPWSLETWGGWNKMMSRYRSIVDNLTYPKITIFGLCMRDFLDFRQFRYAFASALLGDAYFQVSDVKATYSVWPWFDEFEVDLGKPEESAFPHRQSSGHYQRRFSGGLVVVNPSSRAIDVNMGPGYRRLLGKQDSQVNNGEAVSSLRLGPKDGIVLVRQPERR